jgi:phosphotransferase system enzyme I (PtsP)
MSPRRLLARLRALMASGVGGAPLGELVRLVAGEMEADVCSVYAVRPGEILELAATEGLNPEAVGRTKLRVGEGIVGLAAATAGVMNLPDAQNHPRFAYRPETGEEPFAALLAVPIRRAARTLGVLVVQNREPRTFSDDEVEVLETVAMLLGEVLATAGVAADGIEQGVASTMSRVFPASALVPGVVLGPVVLHGALPIGRRLLADDPGAELERLSSAAERVQRELDELIAERVPEGEAPREVLEAYRLIAADAGWLRRAGDVIRGGLSAEAAVQRVAGELRDKMRRIKDPYLKERLADVEDMARRLLVALSGADHPGPVPPGAILIARRLGPAELLDWHARGIGGAVVEEATPGGHAAILARALGMPTLGGVRGALDAACSGDDAVLDADDGQLVLRPEAEIRQSYARALEARSRREKDWAALRRRPAVTADGTHITLMLNVGLGVELDQLAATGAEGIGLFRTEIAMLARGAIADAAEQAAIYARVLDAAAGRPVVFRTLDLGGDKLLPGMEVAEENPAMGWRSIRIGLDRPALLRRQLRALLLAADGRPLSVMFPMIATVAEFRAARALLEAEATRVQRKPERLEIGTMFEVPSLAWQLPALLKVTDFISIGSNDLLQFLFAADRGTPALSGRYDLLSPPVLDLFEQVIVSAGAAGVPVSLCGEAAARPVEAMVLVGLGLTTLSMPATGILSAKALLASLDLQSFRRVLTSIRQNAGGEASVREPILAWARDQRLPI